jgi:hypothetical protein
MPRYVKLCEEPPNPDDEFVASMPNVGLLPRVDRVNAMATWLQQNTFAVSVQQGGDAR